MNKCPKCGSKYTSKLWLWDNHNDTNLMYCQECNHEWDSKAKEKYQARLDKVLSKFERVNEKLQYIVIVDGIIEFEKGKFYWDSFSEHFEIQLDTVELLLRDLGVDLDE